MQPQNDQKRTLDDLLGQKTVPLEKIRILLDRIEPKQNPN